MHDTESDIPVRIALVGGGSLNWALTLMADLAHDTHLAAQVRLYDIDHAAAQRNAILGNRYADVSRGRAARYLACSTLAEALDAADVVVISILPGGFDCMVQDIGIPARYGIAQAVGDTVGPGGFVRAMRSIPMVAKIGKAIGMHAPNAFVCNLTNPMSVLTDALYAAFPGIRAWGECHEVTKIRRQVSHLANRDDPDAGWTHRDVEVNVLGINHFTFVDMITLGGRDMMPTYHAFADRHRAEGWTQTEPGKDSEHARYFGTSNLVAFDLLARFGIPAAAGDRHLAEFLPATEYLSDPARWGFALTPVDYRIRDRARKLALTNALARGEHEVIAKRSDEAMVDQVVALMGGPEFVSNVNLPNTGQIRNLPVGAIVESNATFSVKGIKPQPAGALPEPLAEITLDHARRQQALVPAVLDGNTDALFDLFQGDPLVAPLPRKLARQMFTEMIAATAQHLPTDLRGAA